LAPPVVNHRLLRGLVGGLVRWRRALRTTERRFNGGTAAAMKAGRNMVLRPGRAYYAATCTVALLRVPFALPSSGYDPRGSIGKVHTHGQGCDHARDLLAAHR
jgi:hypothetical protein